MRLRLCLPIAVISIWSACGDNRALPVDSITSPQCSDAINKDGDGTADYPAGLGCESAEDDSEDSAAKPQCMDGRDNDNDGKIDFPNDPGCAVPNQDDESDPCPGAGCPQCADGIDNDGNGQTDYPTDPGCASAADDDEFVHDPQACGPSAMIKQLPANGIDNETLGA